MNILDKHKAGLAFGTFFGLFHAVWSLLVLLGWAQSLIDWIFYLHFIVLRFSIAEFQLGTAVLLVAFTSVVGYIFGWVIAAIWNWVHKS